MAYFTTVCGSCDRGLDLWEPEQPVYLPQFCFDCVSDEHELREHTDERGCCTYCTPDGCHGDYQCCRHD